jgi:hypothetical protein
VNSVRSVILVVAALPVAAWAQEPAAPAPTGPALVLSSMGPIFQIVPTLPVEGAAAPSELYLLALQPDGTPMTGLKLKSPKTAGMEKRWLEVGEGIYRMPFAPPEVLSPSLLTVSAKGRSPDGVPLAATASVKLVPARPAFGAEITPKELILGKDTGTQVAVGGIAATELRSAVNAGSLSVTGGTDSAVTLSFEPPKLNYPHTAIVTLSDASSLARYTHDVLRLDGAVDFPVKGEPQSSVLLDVAGRTFGPVVIGAEGKARVPIIVPPGVNRATQITTVNGAETREELDLRIPETRRLQLVALPAHLPAEGSVPLRVVVVQPTGGPDEAATVTFNVSKGEVGPVSHLGQGVYEAQWTPAASGGSVHGSPRDATVTVTLGAVSLGPAGTDAGAQTETTTVSLVSGGPGLVSLSASVPQIDAASNPFDVTATVKTLSGSPYTGAQLEVVPAGALLSGEVTDLGDGTYRFTIDPLDIGDVSLKVTARGRQGSQNPVSQLRLTPEALRVANDGQSTLPVHIGVVDAFGLPLAAVPLVVEAVGDGQLSATQLVSDAHGVATTTYTAGTSPGVVALQVTAGQRSSFTTVYQLPASVPTPKAPWNAPPAEALSAQLAEASLVVPREGTPIGTEPVATLRLSSDLVTAEPGAKITLTAAPLDAKGLPTKALVPEFVVTGALLSPPVVNPDGSVTATLVVPDDAAVPIAVRATAGEIIQTLSVPIDRADPWASSPAAMVEPAPASGPVATAPAPRTSGAWPWFRVRASGVGSQYRYEQSPSDEPGPLLPTTLAVGRGDAGGPAAPLGGELDLRAWGDALGVPYVGVHSQARFSRYGVQAEAFGGVASDILPSVNLDLVGRYPLDLAGDRYWVGAKAGFHYTDFLTYNGCLEPGCQVRTLPVGVAGLGLGGELGAEIGDLFVIGGYTLGLANGSKPYANAIDLNVGYAFVDHVFADLGFGMLTRQVVLQGTESGLERGALTDSQLMLELGVGFSL